MLHLVISKLVRWRMKSWNYYIFHIRRHLPAGLRRRIGRIYGRYVFWRISPGVTNAVGPRYRRSRDRIDVDVTWNCNLRCYHCYRSCQHAPTEEKMTVGQIQHFLEQSRERKIRWKEIQITGGEPTLHPDFDEIVRLVLDYRNRFSRRTNVKVTTNGCGPEVTRALDRIPAGVDLRNTNKNSRWQEEFVPFNLAPCDLEEYAGAAFRNGCCLTRDSGIGLSPYGYYPCVVAGAIDRIMGFDCGRKSLPDAKDGMEQEMARFCSLCGFFRMNYTAETNGEPLVSPTWERAYETWRENAPTLTRFPEI